MESALAAWLKGIADQFAQINAAMQSSNEPYFQQYRQQLDPHFAAMAKLPELAPKIVDQLTANSNAAADAYKAVLGANAALRSQLADQGELADQGPVTTAGQQMATAQTAAEAANGKLSGLVDAAVPPLAPTARGIVQRDSKPADVKPTPPAASPAGVTAPAAGADTKGDLDKFLSGLKSGIPLGGTPMSPMGGGVPLGGTPLAGQRPVSRPGEPAKLEEPKKPAQRDEKKAELSMPKPDNKTGPAKPAGLGTNPEAKQAPVPAGTPVAKKPTPPNTTVDVRGEKVKFPDAKTAKLAELLAASDRTHPVSLSDAAAKAGLVPPVPGQDPGQQIPPVDARPGDVLVAGDQRFLLLNEGRFLDFANGRLIDADMLPKDLGDRAGYFRLHDPDVFGPNGPGGPVSGQTPAAVSFTVPNPDAAPQAPVDGSPPSVPVTGTPGVPKQGGEGPVNDAATDAGIGEPVPSSTVTSMDPTAVK